MKRASILTSCILAVSLTACGGPGGMSHQDSGTLLGAVGGGLIGNQFGKGGGRVAATAAGVLVGGLIGNQIGKDLDEQDRRRAREAELAAMEEGRVGYSRRWRNPDNGYYGVVTTRRVYVYESMPCREYEHTIYINGRPETMVGKACRNPDGTWSQI